MDCPTHGIVETEIFKTIPGVTIGMYPDGEGFPIETDCPRCGAYGPILSGHYTDQGDHSDAVLTRLTPEQWERLQQALRRVVAEKVEDPLAEIAKVNRELAGHMADVVEEMKKKAPRTTRETLARKLSKAVLALILAAASGAAGNLISDAVEQHQHQQPEPQPDQQYEQLNHELQRLLREVRRSGRIPVRSRPAAQDQPRRPEKR